MKPKTKKANEDEAIEQENKVQPAQEEESRESSPEGEVLGGGATGAAIGGLLGGAAGAAIGGSLGLTGGALRGGRKKRSSW